MTGVPGDDPANGLTDGTTDDTGSLRQQYASRPRWVIVLLVVAAIVVVVLLVALASGTGHGPGRHLGTGS